MDSQNLVEVMEHGNLKQVICGPLKLQVPSLVTLPCLPDLSLTDAKRVANKFKGHFAVTNNGPQLVVYKILVKQRANYIGVNSSYGFVEPNETEVVNVCIRKSVSNSNFESLRWKDLSLLILATTCEVIDETCPTDLPTFWRNVRVGKCSKAFVEVLEVKFRCGKPEEIRNNNGCGCRSSMINMANANYDGTSLRKSGSIGSTIVHARFQQLEDELITEDSEGSGDCSSSCTKITTRSVAKMRKLSKKMIRSHKIVRAVYSFLLFAIAVVYLFFIQRNLRKVEMDIHHKIDNNLI